MSSSYINPALGNIRDNLNKVIQSGNKVTLHTYTKAFYVQGENTNFNDITTFERVEISPISEDSTQIKFKSFDSAPDANGGMVLMNKNQKKAINSVNTVIDRYQNMGYLSKTNVKDIN